MPSVTVPVSTWRTSATALRASSTDASTRPACPRSVRPASVSASDRPARTNSATPSSDSSSRTCSDTDGCARCSSPAAALNEPLLGGRQEVAELLQCQGNTFGLTRKESIRRYVT